MNNYSRDYLRQVRAATHSPDAIVLVANNKRDADFWRERARDWTKHLVKPECRITVVCENWPGGAGNGLGTLHACQQLDPPIVSQLAAGAPVFMYHTSGEGSRLAPLTPISSHGKGAIRLPGNIADIDQPTLLEAIIAQTSPLAPFYAGRLTTFWNDQLFIPAQRPNRSTHPVALFCRQQEQNVAPHYGALLHAEDQGYRLIEKSGALPNWANHFSHALSLGAFSLTLPMLQTLLEAFKPELTAREGKFDTDPHFWMPLSLELDSYLQLQGATSQIHYERMTRLRERLGLRSGEVIDGIDIGVAGYWWDFGQIATFREAMALLEESNSEASALRQLLGLEEIGPC